MLCNVYILLLVLYWQVQFMDIVCVNRYPAWYSDSGRTDLIQLQVKNELITWHLKFKKPVLITEYGAGSVIGMHTVGQHHHQILLLLVEHRAFMKSFQASRSPAIPLTLFHDLLVLRISSSIDLRHVLFGLPLLLYPWGFHSNAVFSIAPVSLHNVSPIQFHFLLFIWFSIDFWWVILHSFSFVILLVHFIFIIISLKHLFTNICSLLFIWLVVFQVPQAYNNTDFTFVLNIRILTSFDMLRYLHTGYSWTNTLFAFLILLATSSSVPPLSDTTLPRYAKDQSSTFPFPLT